MIKKYGAEALALAALALLILAFFWPLLFGGYCIPWGGGDLVSFLWPTWRFAACSLRQGVLPLWNPTLYAGAPFAADQQSCLFYPINLVVFLLGGEPGYATMEGLVILHVILAGWLMYALLRGQGLGRTASLFGGLAYALSDLFITHIGNLNLNATAAYLPALILLADRAFTRRSAGWAAAAGAVLAVAALAGHAQMLLFLGLALALLILYRLVGSARQGGRAVAAVIALGLVVALVGLAGAAVSLLPAYELMGHTARSSLSWEEATRFSLPWRALVGWVAPGFYGRGTVAFWGSWERVEVGYLGVLPLALVVAGLLSARQGGKDRFPLAFFALVALLGLAIALGGHTPLYRLLHALPGFRGLRAPARAIILADFGLAALAAYGLERIRHARRAQVGAMLALALALVLALGLSRAVPIPPERVAAARQGLWLAALLCLAGLLWVGAAARGWGVRWQGLAALLILALDLIASGSLVEVERKDHTREFRHDEVVARLRSDPNLYRIDSSAAHAWQPDTAALYGLYDMGGVPNPLNLGAYESYRWSISARGDRLYSLLGVKYVLADKGIAPGDQRLAPVYTDGPAVDIYLNTTAYPMAQLLYEARQVESHQAAFAAIHDPAWDAARTVVLEEKPQPLAPPAGQPVALGFSGYGNNWLSLHVSTPTPAYLLLSEVYYPGWRASIDGQPTPVLRADYLFRAVYVPAGTHEVRLWFSPPSFWIGLGLSVATWLGLLAAAIVARWRRL